MDVFSINRKCTYELEKENFMFKVKNNGLEQDYVGLQKQQNSQESSSKPDNLLIHNLHEEEHDDDASCITSILVRNFLCNI